VAASTLTIEELTGKKRRLVLKGSGLPRQGAGWASRTVVATRWNPGNPDATQHVLSPQEMPSDWQGEWNTNRLVVAPCEFIDSGGLHEVALAYQLAEALDSIRLGGQLLRVTWINTATRFSSAGRISSRDELRITRVGRITEFEPRYRTLDDVQWSVTFEWSGRGLALAPTLEFRGEDLIAAARTAMAALDGAVRAVFVEEFLKRRTVDSISTFSLGSLESMATAPLAIVESFGRSAQQVTNRLKHVGDLVLQVRDLPAAIAGHVLDVATNAVSVANQFVDEAGRRGPEQMANTSRVAVLARTAAYYGRAQTQAELVSASSLALARQARQRRVAGATPTGNEAGPNDVLAIIVPREGETLLQIAMRYYGTDLSAELARANGLPAYTVLPPERTPIIVPVRTVLEQRTAATA